MSLSFALAHNWHMRVLVVDDHVALAAKITEGLRDFGMAVDTANDGAAALEAAAATDYDVVVLDRDLPTIHGDRVCRELARSGSGVRILLLTASTSVADRVEGLELGANDYLCKPFAFDELVARVRALGRREPSRPPIIEVSGLVIDRARHRVSRDGVGVVLSKKEFGVLERLAASDGAVISAEELLEHVWDANADPFSNVVAVTIARLRKKLGPPELVRTVVGVGYRL
jgi:DNA-binding response OmpR family regulator